jgi:CubicO group peptidase (beta-lactamase class C family)
LSAPEPLVAELRREVVRLQVESPAPSVNAALFRDQEVLWSDAIGLADIESGREASPDTQYAIASITKTFVAASVLILRDERKLELDDPLGRHLEEGDREGVTLRRLLAHVSGIQREPPGDVWDTLEMPDRQELLASLADAEQVLPPRKTWHYSNLAYALLGEVVHRCSEVPCEQFMQERLLGPLGLERTTWGPGEGAATGYYIDRFADVATAQPIVDKRAVAPAGALWSTTGDLARWGAFLADPDPKVLAPDSVEEMHALQVMADPATWTLGWGLGLMLHRRGERLLAGHDGGTVGHASHLCYARKEKVGLALLTNTENPLPTFDAVALTAKAADALPAEPEPWRPGAPLPNELEGVLGIWWGEGVDWWFEWRGGKLEARRPGRPARATFEPETPDRFRTVSGREQGELLRIVRDENGVPVRLYWATYPFTRVPHAFG